MTNPQYDKIRHIRVEEELWQNVKLRAAVEGTTVSAVVREFLTEYAGFEAH